MAASSTDAAPRPVRTTPVSLAALAADVGRVEGDDLTVSGITAASGLVRPGDVFAALPGRNAHGIVYAADAIARGAVAVLTDEAGLAQSPPVPTIVVPDVRAALGRVAAEVYDRPADGLRMLGVTGTSGKTTTTFLMRAGLVAAGRTPGVIGTVATMIGDETLEAGFTTPEAPELQALLATMVERGVTDVAMEVSSHALTMGRVDGVEFTAGGFTNLSEDHLDFHTDMDDYFRAKMRLFDLAGDNAVIVRDDEWGEKAVRAQGACTTVATIGDVAGNSWEAHDVVEHADGTTTFRVLGPWWSAPRRTGASRPRVELAMGCAIPGRYNVANAVLALAMLFEAGVDPAVAAPAISTASVPGRMERIDAGQDFLAVVDYSHKPAAVDGALSALRSLTSGRLIIALGCGGDRDRGKRPHMGAIAAQGADVLIVTDDNPRSEDPAAIRRAMLAGITADARAEVVEIGDRGAAIAEAVGRARPGDTVLIAGKGHETGQEIAGVVHPFDDRAVLRAAIEAAR